MTPEQGLPGGPVLRFWFSAGASGSIPGQGTKIPHSSGQPSLPATTKTQWTKNKYLKQHKKKAPGKIVQPYSIEVGVHESRALSPLAPATNSTPKPPGAGAELGLT